MTVLRSKVSWIGETKPKSKGYSMAFKVEDFDGYLSVWGLTPDEVRDKFDFDKGNLVEVDFKTTDNGFHNVNSVCLTVPGQAKLTLDTIQPLNSKLEERLASIEFKLDTILEILYGEHPSTEE